MRNDLWVIVLISIACAIIVVAVATQI